MSRLVQPILITTANCGWRNPPANTVVTMTPYHVGNADKVLILFNSGAVEKVRAEDFLNDMGGTDATPNGTSWKVKP